MFNLFINQKTHLRRKWTARYANTQIDKVAFPSWQTQISGYKKWTLRTPAECFFKCKRIFEVFMEPGSTSECLYIV